MSMSELRSVCKQCLLVHICVVVVWWFYNYRYRHYDPPLWQLLLSHRWWSLWEKNLWKRKEYLNRIFQPSQPLSDIWGGQNLIFHCINKQSVWHSLTWLFFLSRQGGSTNVVFKRFSSAPPFDTIVNRLRGLWASLEKLVSQFDGSLLAEGQGHISMESGQWRFGFNLTQTPFTPPKRDNDIEHFAINSEKCTKKLVQSCHQQYREYCKCVHLM